MTEALKQVAINLIKQNLHLKPRYTNAQNIPGFSNHQPMMIYSLYYMGASKERMEEASKINLNSIPEFNKNLKSVPNYIVTEENFKENLGKDDYYLNYLDFFREEQNRFSTSEEYLNHQISRIPSLVYAEAFHCLIRLGFMLDMELNEGYPPILAYAATGHFPLVQVDHSKKPLTITEILSLVFEQREYFEKVQYPTFIMTIKMKQLQNDQVFQNIFSHPIIYEGEKTQKELLDFISKTYVSSDNFTTMHAFNSTLPIEQILHFMENKQEIFELYFKGLMTAFVSSFPLGNYKELLDKMQNIPINQNLPSFEKIFEEIVKFEDEHKAKTVYALHKRHLQNPDNLIFHQKAAINANLIK